MVSFGMKMAGMVRVAAMLLTTSQSLAASLIVWPLDPTTQDSLVLEVAAAPPCATVSLDAARLVEAGVIQVPFDDGSRVLCSNPDPCPMRIPLGRLPPGRYTVEFVPDRPSLAQAAATTLTVYAALADEIPIDDGSSRRYGRIAPGCRYR